MSDAPDFKLLLKVEVHAKRGSIARYVLVLMASVLGLLVAMLIPIAWWWMFHGSSQGFVGAFQDRAF